jgi:hypothetical protein
VSAFSRRTEIHGAFFFFGESALRALFETRASDDILTLGRQPHTVLDRALVASKSALLAVSLRVAVSARRRLRKERS